MIRASYMTTMGLLGIVRDGAHTPHLQGEKSGEENFGNLKPPSGV